MAESRTAEFTDAHGIAIVYDVHPARTDRTRAVLLNSPHNPTGRVYTREELQAIGGIAQTA